MTQTTSDHGGLYYVELIKSNLQFIYGKECLLEILSQIKAPDLWQVSILKTEDGVRSVAFFDSGVGLLPVLEKLHRKSAEMLNKFISENTAEATAYVRRTKMDAAMAAKASSGKDQTQETKKKRGDEGAVVKRVISPCGRPGLSLLRVGSDSDDDDVGEHTRHHRVPSNWRTESPSEKIVSIKSDNSLRSRSLICPNYGPASAFYRLYPPSTDVLDGIALLSDYEVDHDLNVVKKSKLDTASSAPAPVPVAAPVPAHAIKTQAQSQITAKAKSEGVPHDIMRRQMENHYRRIRTDPPPSVKNVILFIQWPGYGQALVADECQLKVRAVQNRVRHMLQARGPGLFGDRFAISPAPFTPAGLMDFTVTVKAMTINGQVVVLGPSFGDDLTMIARDLEPGKSIKIEVELKWNGIGLNDPSIPRF